MMKALSHILRLTVLAALLAGSAVSARPATPAHALGATFFVNTQNDDDPPLNDGYCSLREAITNANNDALAYDDCLGPGLGADTIQFSVDPSTMSYFPLNSTLPTITDPDGLLIYGGGVVALDGQNHRLFHVDPGGVLTLASLQLHHGYSSHGGAIISYGALTVTNSVLYANRASIGGGAINQQEGTLTVANSLFLANFSDDPTSYAGAVAAMSGTTTLRNNTFSGNRAATGGDLYVNINTTSSLINNIFANSGGGGNCAKSPDVVVSGSNNLIEDASSACGFTNGENGNLVGGEPMFHPDFYGIALQSSSPAIDAGDAAACAEAPVNNTSLNGLPRPQGIHCDIGAYEYPQTAVSATMSFYSTANEDGHILESSETSNKGGSKNNTSTMLYIGDNAANKQYRSIVSFDTFNLPTHIVITAVTLKFKYAGKSGSLPFNTHGKLLADVKQGSFNDNPALELADFKAAASKNAVLSFTNTLDVGGFYSQSFDPSNFQYINRNGPTQFKLRFAKDDNNDFGADYLKIYSGGSIPGTQPELVIGYTYYVR